MRASQLFFQTLRTTPGDDRLPGQQLMIRAGMLRPLAPHRVALLPLGVQARRRIARIAVEAIEASGAQEVALPAPSQEDAPDGPIAALLASARAVVQSYRQLPVQLYERTRDPGDTQSGLCVDLYGLHAGAEDLEAADPALRVLLRSIFDRCGVEAVMAEADLTPDGRPAAHAFVFAWSAGDVAVLHCLACGYAAAAEVARSGRNPPAPEPPLPMEPVATPGCKTIAGLAEFLGIPEARTAKAVMLMAEPGGPDERFIFAVVRGDTDLNEAALRRVLGVRVLAPAAEAEIRRIGAEPGYASPVALHGVTVVVDGLVAASPNLAAGANRAGYHLRNVNCGRDFRPTMVADIAQARGGDPCPECGKPLQVVRGVELGRVRLVGDGPAAALGVTYLDREGAARPLALSHTRIYLDRLLGATAETHYDDKGLTWPVATAPFEVYLMTAGKALSDVTAAAETLYATLQGRGYAVLYDDRDERAGVKFNDADLLGIPVRVVVGERGLREGVVEVKPRAGGEVELVALEALVGRLGALLR